MINILVGALVGGLLNVGAYVIAQKIKGEPLSWRDATGSFVGGAVGGALVGATFGAAALEAGGVRAAGFLAEDGAASWATERATDNALEGEPILKHVARDAAIGAVEGPLFYFALGKPLGKLGGKLASSITEDVEGPTTDALKAALEGVKRATKAVVRTLVGTRVQARVASAFTLASAEWATDATENVICYFAPEPTEPAQGVATLTSASPPRPSVTRGITDAVTGTMR